jgi:UDP-N-acetylglucosamine 2-epimerase (non-hydrolysing)
LKREGVPRERIRFVGNVMIDSLLAARARADGLNTLESLSLRPQRYAVCTLHRPSNVDDPENLAKLIFALDAIAEWMPVVFAVHPRTKKAMAEHGFSPTRANLRLMEPLGYLEFLALTSNAQLVLTDSGGLQEETTAMGVPCLTLRENTERPITVEEGTNVLVGTDPERIVSEAKRIWSGNAKRGRVPLLWDGHTGQRIAALYEEVLLRDEKGFTPARERLARSHLHHAGGPPREGG